MGAWHGIAHRKVLDGGCQEELSSAAAGGAELLGLLRSAEDRKRRAATAMNERSSRAHAVLIFRLLQRDAHDDGAEDRESTMCLADLGGSEQVRPATPPAAGPRGTPARTAAARRRDAGVVAGAGIRGRALRVTSGGGAAHGGFVCWAVLGCAAARMARRCAALAR